MSSQQQDRPGSPAVSALDRLRRLMAREGLSGALRIATARVRPRVHVDETHVWSFVDLAEPYPHPPLAPEVTLRRASAADLSLLPVVGQDPAWARDRLAQGHELFVGTTAATDGEPELVFAGWVFHGSAPTIASPGGGLPLPPGVVNVEDTATAPAWRGRGIAPAAYAHVFDLLRNDGASLVVGKVEAANRANRRALAKTGWLDFAEMRFRRIGPWTSRTVRAIGDDPRQREWAGRLRTALGIA